MSGAEGDRPGSKPASARQLLRQQRELEEKRKFGLAPLAVDTVSGQEISPNIPQSIARAPWYYGATGPTLDHQRKQSAQGGDASVGEAGLQDRLQESADTVVVLGQATRFTAGACRNCGSRTHKAQECTQAKKRVAAKYTHRVTGEDLLVTRAVRTDGQKRDRLLGEVGVDMLQAHPADDEDAEQMTTDGQSSREGPAKVPRREDVFGLRTAQHGAGEIQELPKYLQNIGPSGEEVFFDPKTGSMRGNPNAHDLTRAFQGDLERYRSGDFFNYVEAQHRYLTGQSKSFVDFALDAELNAERGVDVSVTDPHMTAGDTANPSSAAPSGSTPASPPDALVRALYGETSATVGGRQTRALAADPTLGAPAVATPEAAHDRLVRLTHESAQAAADAGHTAAYGSYCDPVTLQWGYACCAKTGPGAAGCVM